MRARLKWTACCSAALLALAACDVGVVSLEAGDSAVTGGTALVGEACGSESFSLTADTPDVLIALDRSGSMQLDRPDGSRLSEIVADALGSLTSALDNKVWFGLLAFPSAQADSACNASRTPLINNCAVPARPDIQVARGTSSAIRASLVQLGTCGGTPTRRALEEAKRHLGQLQTDHEKYIVLATDGLPNCDDDIDRQTCPACTSEACPGESEQCLKGTATPHVLDELCQAGVKTYVIGLGASLETPTELQRLAEHGCTKRYYPANDPDELQRALAEIGGTVTSCVFHLDCTKIENSARINLLFDGRVIPQSSSQTAGWNWTQRCNGPRGQGTIQFFGEHCQQLLDKSVQTVSTRYGCATIVS